MTYHFKNGNSHILSFLPLHLLQLFWHLRIFSVRHNNLASCYHAYRICCINNIEFVLLLLFIKKFQWLVTWNLFLRTYSWINFSLITLIDKSFCCDYVIMQLHKYPATYRVTMRRPNRIVERRYLVFQIYDLPFFHCSKL